MFFFALRHLGDDLTLAKYWPQGLAAHAPCQRAWEATAAAAAARAGGSRTAAGGRSRRGGGSGSSGGAGLSRFAMAGAAGGLPPAPPATSASPPRPSSSARGTTTSAGGSADSRSPVISFARAVSGPGALTSPSSPLPLPAAPQPGGEAISDVGDGVAASAPPPSPPPVEPMIVGYVLAEDEQVLHTPSYPSRPGKTQCEFYARTGHCRYGDDCVFDHPPEFAVPLTQDGLPYRAGEPVCSFYAKTGQCKYTASCKFHHPLMRPVYAGSAEPAPSPLPP